MAYSVIDLPFYVFLHNIDAQVFAQQLPDVFYKFRAPLWHLSEGLVFLCLFKIQKSSRLRQFTNKHHDPTFGYSAFKFQGTVAAEHELREGAYILRLQQTCVPQKSQEIETHLRGENWASLDSTRSHDHACIQVFE